MTNKYKIRKDLSKEYNGVVLFRIEVLKDFSNIKKGEIGGYVEKKENLSQSGNSWVYGNALVSDDARVYGNSRVYGNALVSGDARVSGDAMVYGNARVSGNSWVYGNAMVYKKETINYSPINLIGLKWTITITKFITIGCECHTYTFWKKASKETISKMDEYAPIFWEENKDIVLKLWENLNKKRKD